MARIFTLPKTTPIDGGVVVPGALATFYLTGTTTKTDTYTDDTLTTPHANPVVADSAGVFATIYLDPDIDYKLKLEDSTTALIYTVDPVMDTLTQANIGKIFYPKNAAETSAGVTIVNFFEIYGNVLRYRTNTTPGTTDMTDAIKDAVIVMDTAGGGEVAIPAGLYSTTSMGFSNIANVRIQGYGMPTIRSDGPGSVEPDRNIFNFTTGCTEITIDGLDLNGNYDTHLVGLPANTNNHCIGIGFLDWQGDTVTCERFRITNCRLRRSGWQKAGVDKFGDNIAIFAANDVWIENNKFEDPGRWHISAGSGARHTVVNNKFTIDTTNRNYALGSFDWEYSTKTSRGGDHLIQGNEVLGMARVQFSGDQGQTNIRIIGNYLDAEDVDGNLAAGSPAANRGISPAGCSQVVITDNILLNFEANGGIIIDPDGASISGIIIANNYVDVDTNGIHYSAGTATNIQITGNFIKATGAGAVGLNLLVAAYSEVLISGNRVESDSSWPARIQSTTTTCVNNRFVGASGQQVQFYCSANSLFMGNSYDFDYRFETVSGATGCFIGPNKGGYAGTAIESLEGTSVFFPTDDDRSVAQYAGIIALADDATPPIAGASIFTTGGTTTITDFDDGVTGQEITILSEHAITITDGTNILLHGSANFVMASQDSLTLVQKADGKWYEKARMVN